MLNFGKKADDKIRQSSKERESKLDVVAIAISILSLFVSCHANYLNNQQLKLNREQQEKEVSPLFYIKEVENNDYIWEIMGYYLYSSLNYSDNELQIDLFNDFDEGIFYVDTLYDMMEIDYNDETIEKVKVIKEKTKGNYETYYNNEYCWDIFNYRVEFNILQETDLELIRYILNSRFIYYLSGFHNKFVVENRGAEITNLHIYPCSALKFEFKNPEINNIYFWTTFLSCNYDPEIKNYNEGYICFYNEYFISDIYNYWSEKIPVDYLFDIHIQMNHYICIEYNNINRVTKTEWYMIDNNELYRIDDSVLEAYFPMFNNGGFMGRGYTIAELYSKEIGQQIFDKLENFQQ